MTLVTLVSNTVTLYILGFLLGSFSFMCVYYLIKDRNYRNRYEPYPVYGGTEDMDRQAAYLAKGIMRMRDTEADHWKGQIAEFALKFSYVPGVEKIVDELECELQAQVNLQLF